MSRLVFKAQMSVPKDSPGLSVPIVQRCPFDLQSSAKAASISISTLQRCTARATYAKCRRARIKSRARDVPVELFVVIDVTQRELETVDCRAENPSLGTLGGNDGTVESTSV